MGLGFRKAPNELPSVKQQAFTKPVCAKPCARPDKTELEPILSEGLPAFPPSRLLQGSWKRGEVGQGALKVLAVILKSPCDSGPTWHQLLPSSS